MFSDVITVFNYYESSTAAIWCRGPRGPCGLKYSAHPLSSSANRVEAREGLVG